MAFIPFNAFKSLVGGAQAAQQIAAQHERNQALIEANKEDPQLFDARLNLAKAQGTRAQMMNQMLPQMNQGRLALLKAQAAGQNLKNQYIPQSMAIAQENAQARKDAIAQSRMRFNDGNYLQKTLRTSFGQNLLSNNPALARNYATSIYNLAQRAAAPNAPQTQMMGVPFQNNASGAPAMQGGPQGGGAQSGITPQQLQQAMTRAGQHSLKTVTDADARKRVRFAANIDKTLATMDPDALTQYAGVPGTVERLTQEGLAPFGMESDAYDKYKNNLSLAKLLGKQARQFYGDSIQPSVGIGLERLGNPATWHTNPKLAQQQYNTYKNLLLKETQTYRDSLANNKVYQNSYTGEHHMVPRQNVVVIDPNGQVGHIPQSELAAALKQGYRRQ